MYDYLVKNHAQLQANVRYSIRVDGKYRGVYFREAHQLQRPKEMNISIEPVFNDNCCKFLVIPFVLLSTLYFLANEERVSFSKHLILRCSAPWIELAPTLELMHQQRQITVRIDPRDLDVNSVHSAEVQ